MPRLHPTAAAKVRAELADAWHSVDDVLPAEGMAVEARSPNGKGGWYAALVMRRGSQWTVLLTGYVMVQTPTHWREVR